MTRTGCTTSPSLSACLIGCRAIRRTTLVSARRNSRRPIRWRHWFHVQLHRAWHHHAGLWRQCGRLERVWNGQSTRTPWRSARQSYAQHRSHRGHRPTRGRVDRCLSVCRGNQLHRDLPSPTASVDRSAIKPSSAAGLPSSGVILTGLGVSRGCATPPETAGVGRSARRRKRSRHGVGNHIGPHSKRGSQHCDRRFTRNRRTDRCPRSQEPREDKLADRHFVALVAVAAGARR